MDSTRKLLFALLVLAAVLVLTSLWILRTDAKIAYNEIEQHLDQLPADKSARIVLYCRSGRMSTLAAQQLVKLGYTHIFNLEGGMIAWEQAGYTLFNR